MICAEAKERMLEAGRGELEGRGASPLARHIRACPACSAVAGRIVREEKALGSALASAPTLSVDEALAGLRDAPSRTRRWWWAVPAAAAAVAAAVIVGVPFHSADRPEMAGEPSVAIPSARTPSPPPVVEAGDREVAVFATSNPNITVAWIYEEPIE